MKFRSIMAALLVVCMLIACMGVASAEEGKIQITIWHTFTEDQEATLNALAQGFNESQDEYEVIVESQAYSGFTDNVYNAVANGVGPNIIFNYASTAADYVADGLVFDMTSYINDPEIGMTDIVSTLSENVYNDEVLGFGDGCIYYLPAYTTGPVLFYNKTLYDEMGFTAPTTWEELAEQSKAIYEAKGIPGFGLDSPIDFMQSLFYQSGAGYIDTETKTVTFGNEAGIEWLKWFGDNCQAGYFAMNPSGDYWSNDFNAGLVASYYGSCAGVPYITPDGFEYAVAPAIRSIDGTTEWYPSWNRGPIAFNKGEEQNRGTYMFIRYFLQPENNMTWIKACNALAPYGTTKALEGYEEFAAGDAALAAVAANLDIAGAPAPIAGSATVRESLQNAMTNVAGGLATAEDAMAELVTICNEALAK